MLTTRQPEGCVPVAVLRCAWKSSHLKRKFESMGRRNHAKEKLHQVASDLIWDNTYVSVSVNQICQKANVHKGSFYHFFRTKADLAIAAYEML